MENGLEPSMDGMDAPYNSLWKRPSAMNHYRSIHDGFVLLFCNDSLHGTIRGRIWWMHNISNHQ